MRVWQPRYWLAYARAGAYLTFASLYCTFRPTSPTAHIAQRALGKMLRLHGIGCEFESRGSIITFLSFFYLLWHHSVIFIVLFATYSVNVNFRDYLYMLYETSISVRSWDCHTLMHYA